MHMVVVSVFNTQRSGVGAYKTTVMAKKWGVQNAKGDVNTR